jgi:phosphinothricin acetyltransferase
MSGLDEISISPMMADHWPAVRAIYLEGIATRNATFEASVPAWEAWDAAHLQVCRIVARMNHEIVGWAALSPVSGRCIYAGVCEVSVYVAERSRRKRVGQQLLSALVKESEKYSIWTLQAGIFPENDASIALHERCGFRMVGIREKLGKMDDLWRDVVLMERRSRVVGT